MKTIYTFYTIYTTYAIYAISSPIRNPQQPHLIKIHYQNKCTKCPQKVPFKQHLIFPVAQPFNVFIHPRPLCSTRATPIAGLLEGHAPKTRPPESTPRKGKVSRGVLVTLEFRFGRQVDSVRQRASSSLGFCADLRALINMEGSAFEAVGVAFKLSERGWPIHAGGLFLSLRTRPAAISPYRGVIGPSI